MTITLTEQTTDVDQVVVTAWALWQSALEGRLRIPAYAAHAALVIVAEGADQPLCVVWGRFCLTPHDLTLRSCCQTWVCTDHEDEHDQHCTEFLAQLREERL